MRSHGRLWRRLDGSGHDTCRLDADGDGWRLSGTAVFLHGGHPACLTYEVQVTASWHTRAAHVRGWAGATRVAVDLAVQRPGRWTCGDQVQPALDGRVDLDFAFTPATNLIAIRRLALPEGAGADAPAASLDTATWLPVPLPQRYERRSAHTYWYESAATGYRGLLEVDDEGFVRRYPEVWEAIA